MDLAISDKSMLEIPSISYEQAKRLSNEAVWSKLKDITVGAAVISWLGTHSDLTRRNYESCMNQLVRYGLLDPNLNLQQFSLMNHEAAVDGIKLVRDWKEATKQARAAGYISFTGFLSRRTQGLIRKAIPSREGAQKTFFKVREKVSTKAMSRAQWTKFLDALESINRRDYLIAKTILQGGKRAQEVLSLTTDQVSFSDGTIRFLQSKVKGMHKELLIHYPERYIEELKGYIGDRTGFVFVTRSHRMVRHQHLYRVFVKAGRVAGLPFQVTPHVLRASVVTYLKGQGYGDTDIMKITGHSSAEMVAAYDKTVQEDNLSKSVDMI